MLYDEGMVYFGEGYWDGGVTQFKEGIEVELDRPIAWVQVMERIETKEQKVSQILGKRAREVNERRAAETKAQEPSQASARRLSAPKTKGQDLPHASARPIRGFQEMHTPKTKAQDLSSMSNWGSRVVVGMNPAYQEGRDLSQASARRLSAPKTKGQDLPHASARPIRGFQEMEIARPSPSSNRLVMLRAPEHISSTSIPTPANKTGVWSPHAKDLMGRGRPNRRLF
ncbi:hypothetical protein HDV63DRAFT_388294 [Trichoderma sp. SZMC 28014]